MSVYEKYCEETFDENGRPLSLKIRRPEDFNFGYDVVDEIARTEPDKRALVWCNTEGEERTFTFQDIASLSNRAANVFRSQGIQKGDRVMLVLKRHYEYWYVTIALHKLGAIMVPVTHMLTPEDMRHRLNSGRIKAVVCAAEDRIPEKIREAVKGNDTLQVSFTVQKDVQGFMNLTNAVETASETLERVPTKATDPLAIYFTSGTSGEPKGVIHDHTYPLLHIVTAKYWQKAEEDGLHFTMAETGWAKTNWGKLYGQWLLGSAVMVYDFDNFDPKQVEHIINKYGVTTFCAPPTIFRYMVMKKVSDLKGLKHTVTAGEVLSKEVFDRFRDLTGITLIEGYGQTETALLLANFDEDPSKQGALGKASPMYRLKVVDEEGNELPAGEIGELVVLPGEDGKMEGVFSGYFENPELYAHVLRGGIFHTGDTAHMDEDGYFWFEGRIDDVIKTGGYRVGPSEVEEVLDTHPAVAECAVIGVEDKARGQAIKAYVVPVEGVEAGPKLKREIREYCNGRLADYKWIRTVEFAESLPKTISGKIRRSELKKMQK